MYKHRQRLHKAEYAAHKQQPLATNIIKQAKSLPNTIRTKRRMAGGPGGDIQNSMSDNSGPSTVLPTATLTPAAFASDHLIAPHFLVGSHFAAASSKMSD